MWTEIIIGLTLGAILGLKFKFPVLIIASPPLLITTFAVEIMLGNALSWALIISICVGAALQVGYVAGALLAAALEGVVQHSLAHRATKIRGLTLPPH